MLAQIKENLLFTLTHTELSLSYDKACSLLDQLDETGKFPELSYNDTNPGIWSWATHIGRIAGISRNKKIIGCPENREKIIKGLRFFLEEHRENSNWWHNQIGLPRNAGCLYLVLEEYLSAQEKDVLFEYVKQGSIALQPNVLRLWRGANLMWGVTNTIYHAVIANDATLMDIALDAIEKDLLIQPGTQGVQSDYSFFQHQTQFYNGGYGCSFVVDLANIIYTLKGTERQLSAQTLSTLGYYIIYGVRYCMRNRSFDYLTVGRELARPGSLERDDLRKALWLLMKVEEMPCRDVMQEQLASIGAEGYALKSSKFFPEVNYYASCHVPYHIGCRGTSPLRSMGETINEENFLSANLYAGGATCIMVDGKEYNNIFPLWDFSHVPGTTAPEENDDEIKEKIRHWHGKNADNTYCLGMSRNDHGLIYQDLNFDGVKGVAARFFVDGIMIAMGAGLTCDKEKNLTTTLNQCWQYDTILTEKDGLPANSVYQGRVAYHTLDGQDIIVQSEDKECSWSRINTPNKGIVNGKVCTFYVSHGMQPENASYAYVAIPAVSANNAAERIGDISANITILRNDEKVQAIRYKDKIFCVFHQNDTLQLSLYDKLVSSAPSAYIL